MAHISQLMSAAVKQKSLTELKLLVDEYLVGDYTADIKILHQAKINELFIETARDFENDLAMELVRGGADLNALITYPVEKIVDERPTLMFGTMIYRYPSRPLDIKPRCVEGYILDILVLMGNDDLIARIGLDKFDLSIYQVGDDQFSNLLNLKINTERYGRGARKRWCREDQEKIKFEHDVAQRLLWCSIFCNWLARNDRIDILAKLRDKYERHQRVGLHTNPLHTSYNTLKIVKIYEQALQQHREGGSRIWHDRQFRLDKYCNFSLGRDASFFCLVKNLEIEFINMLSKNDPATKELERFLSSYYWREGYVAGFCWSMLPVAILTLCFSLSIAASTSGDSEEEADSYLIIVLNSFILSFGALELAKLTASVTAAIATKGRLECLGSPRTSTLRMYTMCMAAEIVQPSPQPEIAISRRSSPGIELEMI